MQTFTLSQLTCSCGSDIKHLLPTVVKAKMRDSEGLPEVLGNKASDFSMGTQEQNQKLFHYQGNCKLLCRNKERW